MSPENEGPFPICPVDLDISLLALREHFKNAPFEIEESSSLLTVAEMVPSLTHERGVQELAGSIHDELQHVVPGLRRNDPNVSMSSTTSSKAQKVQGRYSFETLSQGYVCLETGE
jgi:hypothetical protein